MNPEGCQEPQGRPLVDNMVCCGESIIVYVSYVFKSQVYHFLVMFLHKSLKLSESQVPHL